MMLGLPPVAALAVALAGLMAGWGLEVVGVELVHF